MATYEPQCGQGERFECWCGESGFYEAMFADDLDATCGGSRYLRCYCGGDFCVCHNHGDIECPGCEDCDYDEETDFGDFDPDDHDDDPLSEL